MFIRGQRPFANLKTYAKEQFHDPITARLHCTVLSRVIIRIPLKASLSYAEPVNLFYQPYSTPSFRLWRKFSNGGRGYPESVQALDNL